MNEHTKNLLFPPEFQVILSSNTLPNDIAYNESKKCASIPISQSRAALKKHMFQWKEPLEHTNKSATKTT